ARVVLIDDVATTGKALVESIEVLSRMDVKVIKAICVIDRQEGAGAALAKYGVALQPIFTADEFLK
ncbi:MAG: orotate phosphoribosyltransferase, partial [Candidatus Omnitrophica bacterium]|nr:orotate phosphoribosyltransferase [Candidatus Omnitrophota bacterium]